ncbi:MAG: GAF domain-containing protein, partial [Anaerolineae bacterium]|nr:GAF domain-containing protein [Anaerolineae bacterium]
VFVASETEGNPYHPGDKEALMDSGLYCETVIRTKNRLLVPNATTDEEWKDNPDIKLGMISYLGYPIILPTGDVFGTICVLDNKENHYLEIYEQLVLQFKELIESHLSLLYEGQTLMQVNQELKERISEIKTLRGILPICSFCKKIRDDEGYWQTVETYLREHSEAEFSHGLCLDCLKEHYPEVYEKNKAKYDAMDHI